MLPSLCQKKPRSVQGLSKRPHKSPNSAAAKAVTGIKVTTIHPLVRFLTTVFLRLETTLSYQVVWLMLNIQINCEFKGPELVNRLFCREIKSVSWAETTISTALWTFLAGRIVSLYLRSRVGLLMLRENHLTFKEKSLWKHSQFRNFHKWIKTKSRFSLKKFHHSPKYRRQSRMWSFRLPFILLSCRFSSNSNRQFSSKRTAKWRIQGWVETRW